MPIKPGWQVWEEEFNKSIGLRNTIASGRRFHDIGDGVSSDFAAIPVITDCKSTINKSYSLNSEMLQDWLVRAAERGKMFLLPVRFENAKEKDYVVLSHEDFLTIWLLAQKGLEKLDG